LIKLVGKLHSFHREDKMTVHCEHANGGSLQQNSCRFTAKLVFGHEHYPQYVEVELTEEEYDCFHSDLIGQIVRIHRIDKLFDVTVV
jgi:hypothetical protein